MRTPLASLLFTVIATGCSIAPHHPDLQVTTELRLLLVDPAFYEEFVADFDGVPPLHDGVTDGIVPVSDIVVDLLLKATQATRRVHRLAPPRVTAADCAVWSIAIQRQSPGVTSLDLDDEPIGTNPNVVFSIDGVSRINKDATAVDVAVRFRGIPFEQARREHGKPISESNERAVRDVRPGVHADPPSARGVIDDQSCGLVVLPFTAHDLEFFHRKPPIRAVLLIKPSITTPAPVEELFPGMQQGFAPTPSR